MKNSGNILLLQVHHKGHRHAAGEVGRLIWPPEKRALISHCAKRCVFALLLPRHQS